MRKLDFAKIRQHLNRVPEELQGKETQVGWFSSAQYEDGTPVAYVATIHEFGAPARNIPRRPFIFPTIQKRKMEWAEIMKDGVKAVLDGRVTGDTLLNGLGVQASGDIKQTISEVNSPALKQQTIDRKGSSKPLVETALMMNSVTYKVENT